jgi:predicted nucleic acid-binding protein
LKRHTARSVKVFLDSNVILSGLLSDKSYPRIILDLCCIRLEYIQFFTGEYNLIEIERNLKKKLPQALKVYQKYLPFLNLQIIPLPDKKLVRKLSREIAPKDAPVIASAIVAGVDILVTGDKKDFDHLKGGKNCPFKILSPSEFVTEELPKILRSEDVVQ